MKPIIKKKPVINLIINVLSFSLVLSSCLGQNNPTQQTTIKKKMNAQPEKLEQITLGGGCFWCIETCFSELKGVYKVVSGYAGGTTPNPTYEEVCTGKTGHAEVVQISFNPKEISLEQIMEVFWFLHDPTQLNRQGNDIGTQYRSIVLYNSEEQLEIAKASMEKSKKTGMWKGEYTTEFKLLIAFYPAEDYHQGYYKANPDKPYCSYVVGPKVKKFREKFAAWLK